MADTSFEQFPVAWLPIVNVDSLIDESPPSLAEVREALTKLGDGKAPGAYIISAEMLKVGERP